MRTVFICSGVEVFTISRAMSSCGAERPKGATRPAVEAGLAPKIGRAGDYPAVPDV